MLVFLTYFFLTILFFPLGFIAWYMMNRKRITPCLPSTAMLITMGFSAASYLYVYRPLLARHIDLGFLSTITYGGMLSAHLFLVSFLCPGLTAGRLRLASYLLSCGILVLSVVSWSMIARYYLAGGLDAGALIIGFLGLAWVAFLILVNRYRPPIKPFPVDPSPGDERPALLAVWLLTAGDLLVARLIYSLCRLALIPR